MVRVADGAEVGTAVHEYPHGGDRHDAAGDRRDRCRRTGRCRTPRTTATCCATRCPAALAAPASTRPQVVGIGIDFTACTVLPALADGTPLCELPELRDRPHAYVKLWKHHAAQPQADRINALAARARRGVDRPVRRARSPRSGSSPRALQLLEEDPEIYARTERWIEAADWIVWQLCGIETRNVCTAGYKGIYQDGQLPVARSTSPR